jgi:MSHA biogenesis protein MshE
VIDKVANQYLIGMNDPTDLIAYDELSRHVNEHFRIAVVSEIDLFRVIDEVYQKTKDIPKSKKISVLPAPSTNTLASIVEEAVLKGATDIHIEPDEKNLRIRFRIDGLLQEEIRHEKEKMTSLINSIKSAAKMKISDKTIPQENHMTMKIKNHDLDIRVSTLPVQYGESLVMHILEPTEAPPFELEQLGFSDTLLARLQMLIHKPKGMILVSGPIESGKTTTLYAILNALNNPEKNIVTLEERIKNSLRRINQVQVNNNIGLTFSSLLHSVLRQDPDIIMIDEMHDIDTIQTSLRSAIDGPMLLSSLSGFDAMSATLQLIDMAGQGFLVALALKGVLAQRLLKKICSDCAKPYTPTDKEKSWLKALLGTEALSAHYKKGEGCQLCHQTGYRDRIGVFELLEIDGPLTDALKNNDIATFTQLASKQKGYRPLRLAALDYAQNGITTLSEVFKIAGESFESD